MSEYNELVEKLASEIVAEVAESIEKEAGVKEMAAKAKGAAGKVGKSVRGFVGGDLVNALKARKYQNMRGYISDKQKAMMQAANNKKVAVGAAKAAVLPTALAGTAGVAALMKKKQEAAAEKAAEILFEAQLQKIAAEEAYEEAQLGEDAAATILNELGISPEDVLEAILSEAGEEE